MPPFTEQANYREEYSELDSIIFAFITILLSSKRDFYVRAERARDKDAPMTTGRIDTKASDFRPKIYSPTKT